MTQLTGWPYCLGPVEKGGRAGAAQGFSPGGGPVLFPEAYMVDLIDVVLHLLTELEYIRSWCVCAFAWILACCTK